MSNYKVFSSGTCRLLNTLHTGRDRVNCIHSYCGNEFKGNFFLGKQKNSRNHIQFLNYIKKNIELPSDIMNDFFSAFHDKYDITKRPVDPYGNVENIRNEFDSCDVYIFEIAALKIQKRGEYYISDENTTNFEQIYLNAEELFIDLEQIIQVIGNDKNIIFMNHLRLEQFDGGPVIENREIIYNQIYKICKIYKNVYQYDPTVMIKNKDDYKKYLGDPWHYNYTGLEQNFNLLYNLIHDIMQKKDIMNDYVGIKNHPLRHSSTEFSRSPATLGNTYPVRSKCSLYDSEDETTDFHKNNHI